MSYTQYDVSEKMQELFKKKQQQRTAAKEFWRKQMYNPYNQHKPFDVVLFRFGALSAYSTEYYGKNYHRHINHVIYFAPFFIIGYIFHTVRAKREAQWRSGTIAYADRKDKLLM